MVKHKHPRHVRYPARISVTAGYVLLVTSWLLVIGMAGTVVIEAIFAALPASTSTPLTSVFTTLNSIGSGHETGQGLSVFAKGILLLVLLLTVSLTAHFVTIEASKLLHWFIARIGLKLTTTHLFVTKCLLALLAPLVMMVAVLGLPSTVSTSVSQLLVGFMAFLAVVSVICFAIQHVIVLRAHMAVKNIL